ncbi:hypothetical protein [Ralstonia pseudosolanacearum]
MYNKNPQYPTILDGDRHSTSSHPTNPKNQEYEYLKHQFVLALQKID